MWMPELPHFQMCVACMHIDPLPIASIGANVVTGDVVRPLVKDFNTGNLITQKLRWNPKKPVAESEV